jgi:hypothetical protein
MGIPPFTMIIISVAAVVFIIFVLYVFCSKKTPDPSLENNENDELIFNPETGKYLTVEELINEHDLDYLDEQKCQQVYDALPENLQQTISYKDVETIMEFHYQLKNSGLEEEEIDDDAKYDFLATVFEKKGKPIDKDILLKVIGLAEKKQIKTE